MSALPLQTFFFSFSALTNATWRRYFGQPAAETHPHLMQEGEVTPGISQAEFKARRQQLMEAVANSPAAQRFQKHIVVVPSATKVYMSANIPYVFRQNTDFLYLCGFQEPDSLLVLENTEKNLPDHTSVLFVPKKDPAREMWEGTRSGIEGAIKLTGVNEAYNSDDIGQYLRNFAQHEPFIAWYDHLRPVHVGFHNQHLADFISANKGGFVESPRTLLHKQRLVKSPSEIALMGKTCNIAANAFKEVMKYSRPGVRANCLMRSILFSSAGKKGSNCFEENERSIVKERFFYLQMALKCQS